MNTETKEKVLLGHVWRSGAPFLAGDPTFCFGCGPSVGLPISGLALQKVDCKEAPTVVKPFHHNDEKSQGSPALLSHVEERTALPTIYKDGLCKSYCRLPWWLSGKEAASQCRRGRFNPWGWEDPQRKKWQPSPDRKSVV